MLDDLEKISDIDKSNMLNFVSSFPEQIKESEKIVKETTLEKLYKVDNIIIAGMGASSIPGDIIEVLFRDQLDIPIYVNRKYDIPKWANKNTLLLAQSYSGNTEETLSAFKNGYKKHCKIIGFSSDGKLEEYCKKREIPLIKIPSGIQPRGATGYSLFTMIHALGKTGLLKKDMKNEIDDAIEILNDLNKNIKKDVPEEKNIAKQIARKIKNSIPQIYGWNIYSPIARRWSTQLNENSKKICKYDEVSESNHNDIVGWSMDPEISKRFSCIIFRDSDEETIYMNTRLDFMKKLFKDVAKDVIEIDIKAKKRLSKMMYAMLLGDYVSCYLAVLREIDPTPVEAINQLKKQLSKI